MVDSGPWDRRMSNEDRSKAAGRSISILLVEDDDAYASVLAAVVSGFDEVPRIRRAGDLAGALSVIQEAPPDAVLLDLSLPDSQGVSTLTSVLSAAPSAAIVVLTGLDDPRTAREALRLGAQDWLVKGELDPDVVQRALRYAMERKTLSNQLIRSQKLEVVGQLASRVAHEFNNILTAIVGSAHLLAAADVPEARDGALELLQHAARQGKALSQQLLSLAPHPCAMETVVAVPDLLEGTLRLIEAVLPDSIQLRVGPITDASIRLDPGQFEQLMLNLVLNARDAMPQGGTLSVSVATDQGPADAEPPPKTAHSFAVFRVSDTGTGIEPSILPRLFEPFLTTKGGKGTGLGLAVVSEIVARFRGMVRVDSALGKGTTFAVYIPIASPSDA